MTYKQCAELGGHVRKSEQGSLVVYASTLHRSQTDEASGEEVERDIPFIKGYTVFNVEQIEGLPEQYTRPALAILDPVQRIADAEAFFAATGIEVGHGGNRAFYSESVDRVQMPFVETFRDAERYYATLAIKKFTRQSTRAASPAILAEPALCASGMGVLRIQAGFPMAYSTARRFGPI